MIRDGTFSFWGARHRRGTVLRGAACCFVAAVICLAGCVTAPPVAPEPPLPPGQTIVVQRGQTLSQIARESGVDVEEIVEVNGLRSADDIAAGQLLFIPAAVLAQTPTTAPPPARKPPPTTKPPVGPPTLLSWPVEGLVLRDFATAKAKTGAYDGVLIAAPASTRVVVAAPGRVAFAGSQDTGLGLFVVVEHEGVRGVGDLVTIYGHLETTTVKAGDVVGVGGVIGTVGTSGLVGVSPRVQFQVRRKQEAIDPLPLLPP